MEKPKNYWVRGYVTLIITFLFILLKLMIGNYSGDFLSIWPALILLFMGPLSIAKGIQFKDWNYIALGTFSLVTIFFLTYLVK